MDFFAHQERARKQTRRMLLMFACAVLIVVGATDLIVYFAVGRQNPDTNIAGLLVVLSLASLAVIALGSLYRIASLRGGGAAVAAQLGAMPVPPNTTDFTYQRLRNVVEEIAIAAGVPVPEIFVLEDEAGINAFAAGYAPADAAITVTRGALDKLTREELQGVIGHEFSHVLNGDMRLNIRLIGIVFGILVVAIIGRKIAEVSGRGRGRNSGAIVAFGLALFVVGYLGIFLARIIKASISRQREFLADASAVQFTRQTEGIAGALKKISGLAEGSKLAAHDREEVAHMLFSDGVGYSALFATHPVLTDRIKRLQPQFNPSELTRIAAEWTNPVRTNDAEGAQISISGFAPLHALQPQVARAASVLPASGATINLEPNRVVRQVGNPGSDDRVAAASIHAMIPDDLRAAACQQERAMALIFTLLLNRETATRPAQLGLIEKHYDTGTRAVCESLAATTDELHPMQRLPLAAMAFPALRRRPRPQLQTFLVVIRQLIDADEQVTLSEYCLSRLITVQVIDSLDPAASAVNGRTRLPEVESELADVFAILAERGNDDSATAERAFRLGMQETFPNSLATYAPPNEWIIALDRALPRLDRLAPAGKELVVRGLTRAIGADGKVSVSEAELLRSICASLHCPLPPLLQS
ncbi:MAG: M48 family metallopeptidase [Dokdonella sp.]